MVAADWHHAMEDSGLKEDEKKKNENLELGLVHFTAEGDIYFIFFKNMEKLIEKEKERYFVYFRKFFF